MGPDALLQELQAPLLLANPEIDNMLSYIMRLNWLLPEQLLGSPLIGGKPSNLTDEVSHKLIVLGQLTLGVGGLGLERVLGGLVALFQANTDLVTRSHREIYLK